MTSTTTSVRKPFAAQCAAVIGIAGSVFLSVVPAAQVLAADPPSWSHHDDNRNSDRNSDRRNDKKDEQRDKKDIKNDVRRLRQDQNDLRNDRRDDRKGDQNNDRRGDWRDDHRVDGRDNNDRYTNRDDRYNNNNRDGWNNNRNNVSFNNGNDRRNDSFRDRFEQARQQSANQQKNKNDWRNLTILGGAATLYGVLNHDPTVAFIGAAGTLYSASRYEHDRSSQSNADRARAEVFDRGSFERDGVRYTKRDKWTKASTTTTSPGSRLLKVRYTKNGPLLLEEAGHFRSIPFNPA